MSGHGGCVDEDMLVEPGVIGELVLLLELLQGSNAYWGRPVAMFADWRSWFQ